MSAGTMVPSANVVVQRELASPSPEGAAAGLLSEIGFVLRTSLFEDPGRPADTASVPRFGQLALFCRGLSNVLFTITPFPQTTCPSPCRGPNWVLWRRSPVRSNVIPAQAGRRCNASRSVGASAHEYHGRPGRDRPVSCPPPRPASSDRQIGFVFHSLSRVPFATTPYPHSTWPSFCPARNWVCLTPTTKVPESVFDPRFRADTEDRFG